MKVTIGPYTTWIGPYQIADKIFFWINKNGIYAEPPAIHSRWDYRLHDKFGDWLAKIRWLNNLCNWIESKKERKIRIHIDKYDTWSMDHTLALIVHPMLVQLKNTKQGSPLVNDEDVPEHLRSTSAVPLTEEEKNKGSVDNLHESRWDWVLDEMIWSFEQILDDKAESQFYSGNHDIFWEKREDIDSYEMKKGSNDTFTIDKEGLKKWNDRIDNGLCLFGKYYRSLWD